MAIDSLAKRSYAIGVGLPFLTVYDTPDGTVGAEDRYNIAWNYYISLVLQYVGLTLPCRDASLTLKCRSVGLTLRGR